MYVHPLQKVGGPICSLSIVSGQTSSLAAHVPVQSIDLTKVFGMQCRFFQQLISGVQYCHEQGVFHRDLRLENLMLDGNFFTPNLKISGFGYADPLCILH